MFRRHLRIRINHLNIKEMAIDDRPGGSYKIVSSAHYANRTG